ncbi:hypothetical protein Prudu_004227 [Prunus dulcis]|uniref:Uncharacterized protein n=1 Tax=Prunus dulcis TaxID=3755 RepID=A0A4Y1QUT1_PRUDU|nr:hypothetical protein Prudu_004227 [Prunus dulcis]
MKDPNLVFGKLRPKIQSYAKTTTQPANTAKPERTRPNFSTYAGTTNATHGVTGPDPYSALEFESDPMSSSFYNKASITKERCGRRKNGPVVDSCARLDDTKSTRAANWRDSGDRSQPDPHSWLSRSGVPETRRQMSSALTELKANWMSVDIIISEGNLFYNEGKARKTKKWPGGLGDTKSTRAANWQDSGDRSQPDPHFLALTVRASPKLVRQMSSALTELKANWMSVDIVISEGNLFL